MTELRVLDQQAHKLFFGETLPIGPVECRSASEVFSQKQLCPHYTIDFNEAQKLLDELHKYHDGPISFVFDSEEGFWIAFSEKNGEPLEHYFGGSLPEAITKTCIDLHASKANVQ